MQPMLSRFFAFTLLILALPLAARGQQQVVVTDATIQAGQSVTWTSDKTYVLDGLVYVEEGATLTIEPGTLIWGRATPSNGDRASALIIARGARIFANGTPAQPIVFTAEGDDPRSFVDLPLDATGLWGGVIILGRAPTNRATTGQIEGIPETEPRGAYGGQQEDDNSGVFRFVSIRHGGAVIGANNEINGLTLGGVGRGTTVEYVEAVRNADDGFEWFGGTVDTRYLVSAFNDDDAFDWDEGFRGRGQFWFAIQAPERGDSGAEMDGGTTPEDGQPYATPTIYNATYIGRGASASTSNRALRFRDNSGGYYYNSIFTDFGRTFVSVEDLASGQDSQARLQAGELALQHNLVFGFQRGNTPQQLVDLESSDDVTSGAALDNRASLSAYLSAAQQANVFSAVALAGISRNPDGGLDPRPAAGSPALTMPLKGYPSGFFTPVSYAGAFGDGSLWISGWTLLSTAGYLDPGSTPTEGAPELPADVVLAQNYPNPFNPTTTIEFRVQRPQQVRLAVYDLTGREVAVLVDGRLAADAYRVQFEARSLASGTYLYKLVTEQGVSVRTMLLLK